MLSCIHTFLGQEANTPGFGCMVFGYMVFFALFRLYGQSDFSTKFFGYMVISATWSTVSGQNRGPYIRNPVFSDNLIA